MVTPFDFDTQWLLALNFDGGLVLDQFMYLVSGKLTWVPLYVGVLWWIVAKKGWRTALLFLVVMALVILFTDQTATFFKNHFSKFRPSHNPDIQSMVHIVNDYRGGLYGTVSSHAANSLAFAIMSAMLIRHRIYSWMMVAWVIVVSYSRIYLGVHFPVDIICGLVDGALWSTAGWQLFKFTRKKLKL